MPKLTNYTFVEIFDEMKRAGEITLTEHYGMLDVGQKLPILSRVSGLYCSTLRVLLIDQRCGNINDDGDFVDIKAGPLPVVDALRNVSITSAVRDLPTYADDWHQHVKRDLAEERNG